MALDSGMGGYGYGRSNYFVDDEEEDRWLREIEQLTQPQQPLPAERGNMPTSDSGRPTPIRDTWTSFMGSVEDMGGVDEFNNRVAVLTNSWHDIIGTTPQAGIIVDLARAARTAQDALNGLRAIGASWNIYPGASLPEDRAKMDYFLNRGVAIRMNGDPLSDAVDREWDNLRQIRDGWQPLQLGPRYVGVGKDTSWVTNPKMYRLFDPYVDQIAEWKEDYLANLPKWDYRRTPQPTDTPRGAIMQMTALTYPGSSGWKV